MIIPSIPYIGFYVFYFRQAFRSLPVSMFEAARMDGAGIWRQFWEIALPNVIPSIAALSVISFMGAWNIYLWGQLVLEDRYKKTLTTGIATFADLDGAESPVGTADGNQPAVGGAGSGAIPDRAALHRRCPGARSGRKVEGAKAGTMGTVIVVGHVNHDRVWSLASPLASGARITYSDRTVRLGGGGFHTGAQLAKLGNEVRLVSNLMDDGHGQAALATLKAIGFDLRHVTMLAGETLFTEILLEPNGERTILNSGGQLRPPFAAPAPVSAMPPISTPWCSMTVLSPPWRRSRW